MIDIAQRNNTSYGCAVALGLFDGVHVGHRKVIRRVLGLKNSGFMPALFTFETESVLKKHGREFYYIYTSRQKKVLLHNEGIELIYSPKFSALCNMTGDEFARFILKEKMNAGAVFCGRNFRFGKNASCGLAELKELGKKYGFQTHGSDLVEKNGKAVSSEAVRRLITAGKIKEAAVMLGESYFIEQTVATGNMLGRQLNFPTINQYFNERQLTPLFGVYGSRTYINGKEYPSITNIGVKPTVQYDGRPLAETHILNYKGDLYGHMIRVELDCFIRPEQKFKSIDELKKRVNSDIDEIRKKYSEVI